MTTQRRIPVITYALIALNVLFFLVELSGGDQFIKDWAFIPARFSGQPASNAVTIFTAMFMHGSCRLTERAFYFVLIEFLLETLPKIAPQFVLDGFRHHFDEGDIVTRRG